PAATRLSPGSASPFFSCSPGSISKIPAADAQTEASAGSDPAFQHGKVQPAAELDAHLPVNADKGEAEAFVQAERGLVFSLDRGAHHTSAGLPGAGDQFRHQGPADAGAAVILVDINGMLGRMAKAVEGAPVTERGVAGDRPAALSDENRK